MKSETETKKKFKGVLMFTNELNKANATNEYHSSIEQLNIFIEQCETLLKRKMIKNEIISAIAKPIEFSETVKEIIQDSYPFPQANQTFNHNAMGISFDNLEISVSRIQKNSYKYLVDEGKVIAEPKQINLFQKQSEVYTQSAKQTELYTIAKTLIESANRLNELGVSSNLTQFNYNRATSQLIQNDTTNSLKINFSKILSN